MNAQVRHGLVVSLSINATPLVWLYAVGAHTQDIRVRIPYLIGGLPGLSLILFAVAVVFALLGLTVTRGISWRAIAGASLGAGVVLVVLSSGVIGTLMPVSYESPPRYWLVGFAALGSAAALWRERRQLAQVRSDDVRRNVKLGSAA